MSNPYLTVAETIRNAQHGVAQDGGNDQAVEFDLAEAINATLSIPTNCTSTASSYYMQEHYTTVRRMVSAINELTILDTENVLKHVKACYEQRFNIVNHPEKSFTDRTLLNTVIVQLQAIKEAEVQQMQQLETSNV